MTDRSTVLAMLAASGLDPAAAERAADAALTPAVTPSPHVTPAELQARLGNLLLSSLSPVKRIALVREMEAERKAAMPPKPKPAEPTRGELLAEAPDFNRLSATRRLTIRDRIIASRSRP